MSVVLCTILHYKMWSRRHLSRQICPFLSLEYILSRVNHQSINDHQQEVILGKTKWLVGGSISALEETRSPLAFVFSPRGRFVNGERSSPFTITTSPKSSSTHRGDADEEPRSSLSLMLSPSPTHSSPPLPQLAAVVAHLNQPASRMIFHCTEDSKQTTLRKKMLSSQHRACAGKISLMRGLEAVGEGTSALQRQTCCIAGFVLTLDTLGIT